MPGEEVAAPYPDFIPLMDWYEIWAGTVGWPMDGGPCSLQDVPQGVRLRVQPARQSEPFLVAEKPWEEGYLNSMQVLCDEGRYRIWYSAAPSWEALQKLDSAPRGSGYPEFTCYAESDDGFAWRRPELGLCEFAGSKRNNLLGYRWANSPSGLPLQTIFKDPTAPSEERYKGVGSAVVRLLEDKSLPRLTKPEMRDFLKRVSLGGSAMDGIERRIQTQAQLLGFTSPDGLHWQRLDKPILESSGRLDMNNLVFYDEETGRYVGYLRGNMGRRRTLRKTTSSHFDRGWEEPRQVLMADSQDPPDLDFYSGGYCRRPGGHFHLMFFGAFHRSQDTIDIQLAVSRDGEVWTRPERVPSINREVPGEPGRRYGGIWPSPGLFELQGDWWGQPYFSHERHHWDFDYDNWKPRGKASPYHWALWRRDRLVGLEAQTEGRVALLDRECAGRELRLNFRTEAGGYIKAELVGRVAVAQKGESPPLGGYSFEACEPVQGDSLDQMVRWKGRGELSELKGQNVLVRLHLVKATLFAYAI